MNYFLSCFGFFLGMMIFGSTSLEKKDVALISVGLVISANIGYAGDQIARAIKEKQ